MTYTLSNSTKRAFLIIAALIALWFVLGCDTDTCIDRDSATGVCRETVRDIGTIVDEVTDWDNDGSFAPLQGETGKGVCKTTGINCN